MTLAETSMKAYKEVREKLGKRQESVLKVVIILDNCTNMEIAKELGWSINRVTPRVLELRKAGKLEQEGTRKCKVTGRTAMTWKAKQN